MSKFIKMLNESWKNNNSLLCVGLDPDPVNFPGSLINKSDAIFEFCRKIIDSTAPYVCAFKAQLAYFVVHRAEDQLEQLISYIHTNYSHIPVILDAKRSDISTTSKQYAKETFERYRVDAVTVNPYMGFDSIKPYLDYQNKGIIVLCRTSNFNKIDIQCINCNGKPLYQIIAKIIADHWNISGQMGLVMGATFPNEIKIIRTIVNDMPLLIPGIGSQGGDLKKTVYAGQTFNGTGMLINVSRAIIYAGKQEENYEKISANIANKLRKKINLYRKNKKLE